MNRPAKDATMRTGIGRVGPDVHVTEDVPSMVEPGLRSKARGITKPRAFVHLVRVQLVRTKWTWTIVLIP